MRKFAILAVTTALVGTPYTVAQDAVIGDFENDPAFGAGSGWFDWSGVVTAGQSTAGATRGSYSLAWQPDQVGFYQGLAVKLQNLPAAGPNGDLRAAAFQGLLNNTHIAYDVTWDPADWHYAGSGWNGAELFSLAINFGAGGTYQEQNLPDLDTGNSANPGRWDIANYATVHTRTVLWDYSHLLPQIQALYAAGTMNETNGWTEFMVATNAGNFSWPVTYYIDNVRFTTPAESGLDGDFSGDNTVDGDDLGLWISGFGLTGQTDDANGDADLNGDVEGADFLIWQRQFGATAMAAASISAVPEPSTLALALFGLAVAGRLAFGSRRNGRVA
ncbi:MAG: PEP-CTERM sorting domain-containing protein [Pirellulales bacterium]|nr:PEP-CTERM sorting domain-containing protein [Pirellulales bacterium]